MDQKHILAVLIDCGDTLVDEATEIKPDGDVTVQADLIPGASDLLYQVKQRGYPLALVADGPEDTFRNVFRQHNLAHLFDALAISQLVGCSKPCEAIFRSALDQLNIAQEDYGRVVMVGNYLERDIKGANALGLVSVWLDWSPRRPKIPADPSEQPCYIIKNPLELLDVLDSLEDRQA